MPSRTAPAAMLPQRPPRYAQAHAVLACHDGLILAIGRTYEADVHSCAPLYSLTRQQTLDKVRKDAATQHGSRLLLER
jgi:hypothetical protein